MINCIINFIFCLIIVLEKGGQCYMLNKPNGTSLNCPNAVGLANILINVIINKRIKFLK